MRVPVLQSCELGADRQNARTCPLAKGILARFPGTTYGLVLREFTPQIWIGQREPTEVPQDYADLVGVKPLPSRRFFDHIGMIRRSA